ncbi:DsbA family protein [Shewanella sp. 1CM18E]|uniref:DsbA family protein n=1 Tax=Shewanella sp. 1CM18E TaxID=2929169 RepID=UPI0020C07ECB|nr:DsbA family protein [Shewanella sp. 1CM18E]MCK8044663.1 DsbA family protein [Shewanella sp. 1CM18E]
MKNQMNKNELTTANLTGFGKKTALTFIGLLGLTALGFLGSQLATSQFVSANDSSLSAAQQQEVKAIVKEMLVNDPDLLREAFIALQTREMMKEQAGVEQIIAANQQALFETTTDPWKGAENGEITMVYFTDFNCPYCKQLEPELDKLMAEFPQLKIIIKMVPLQGQSAVDAVDFAQTVWLNEPQKYLQVKDTLMSAPRRLDSQAIAKVASITDTTNWLNNTDSRVAEAVAANLELMRALRIGGTPSMVIGDQIVAGLVPFEQLKLQVEQALEAQNGDK